MKPRRDSHSLAGAFALSAYWFAWEVHWAALLGAAMQAQVARFVAPGATGTATAIFSGAGALFSIVSQFVAGKASDASRRRIPWIVTGTLCDVVALFGFALAPSFVTVVAAFVAVQISLNAAGGPYQALIPERVERTRQGAASAVMAFLRLAGTAVGLLIARIVVVQPGPGVAQSTLTHGLLLLAMLLSAVLIVGLLVTLFAVPDGAPGQQRREEGAGEDPIDVRSFTWLIVSRALVSMGLYLILPFFAFFLRFALHVDAYLHLNTQLLLAINAWSLFGTVPAYLLGDRVSKKTVMFVSFALLAAGAFAIAAASSVGALYAIAIVLGVGWGAYYAVDWALACNLVGRGRAGALMAIWNIGSSGPQVLSPVIGGLLVDRIGGASGDIGSGYRVLFILVGAYVVAGALALIFVREHTAGKARETG